VLIVDDNAFVRKYAWTPNTQTVYPCRVDALIRFLTRLARDRGYYYESCCDGEACVKMFEATLQLDSSACNRFDLIIMDKEMPTADPSLSNTAGVSAVKKIRQLIKLHMEHDPGFKSPCIVGNSSCEESDASMAEFRSELQLMRLQAGMDTSMLIMKEKMSSWSDGFDEEVRGLCGLNGEVEDDTAGQALVFGKPIRLQMLFRNLVTNAIHHGKPSIGRHHIRVSYDLIDNRARVHPCLVRSDQDDEVTRSLSWQLEDKFEEGTQRFVQVIVADNGPGIDANNERMKKRLVRDCLASPLTFCNTFTSHLHEIFVTLLSPSTFCNTFTRFTNLAAATPTTSQPSLRQPRKPRQLLRRRHPVSRTLVCV
jgi:CheY-like chemotaxis protein